ncbi:MAG: FtsX-like permease family protein [Frankiales bacterium]|nr:MAG: FtsX-like permease family protein [Frankiales bacterium]
MRLAEAWRVAVTALRANRLRSLLTMLGVVIGVAAVVVLVAIGSGAKQEVEEQVNGLGANLVIVVPGRLDFGAAPTKSRLELSDATRIERATGQQVAVSLSSGETVRFGGREAFATVNGTNPAVPEVFVRPLARGEYLRESDVDTRRRVAVVGSGLVEQLFDGADPLGRTISVGGVRFRVIGVFESVGGSFGGNRDNEVHVPVTAAQRLFGDNRVDAFALKAPTTDTIDEVSDQALAVLADRYPDEEFSAVTQDQILGTIGRILGLLTTVLAAIAAISLLVGGVGVSNIMLVSVRERTREIGLRKAVGARQRDITLQFLLEAVLLTTLGGVIGIALGVGGSLGLSAAIDQLPAVITWWSPALAFGVSAAVGIFFGVVPARRAGRLDPVAALRTE